MTTDFYKKTENLSDLLVKLMLKEKVTDKIIQKIVSEKLMINIKRIIMA